MRPDIIQEEAPLLKLLGDLRKKINITASEVYSLRGHSALSLPDKFEGQGQELEANIMLAYRHIEDARMRLGKVAQYLDDGVSCYDKGQKPSC